MQPIKAFIFDMDGTLVDNMGLHKEIWLDLLAQHGVHLTGEEFDRTSTGKSNAVIFRMLLGNDLTEEQILELSESKEGLYRERFAPDLKPLPGLQNFLAKAQALGIPMAVATSADKTNAAFVIGGLGFHHFFQALTTAEEPENSKPYPDIFLLSARKLGIPPAACVVFEDSLAGLEAANRAGMQAILVTTSWDASEAAAFPNVIQTIPDFSALSPEDLLQA